ncbi:MAG: hypothetical protein K6G90_09060 [Clostridia bacterium]|nr:hypothetical protein [Clostridia bacterium]
MFGYKNIGKKLKGIGRFVEITVDVISVIGALVLFYLATTAYDDFKIPFILGGIGCIVFGPILGFLSVAILYGFGELVDKVCDIERAVSGSGIAAQDVYVQSPGVQQSMDTKYDNTPQNHVNYRQWQDMNNQVVNPYSTAPVNNQVVNPYSAVPTNNRAANPYSTAPTNNRPQ